MPFKRAPRRRRLLKRRPVRRARYPRYKRPTTRRPTQSLTFVRTASTVYTITANDATPKYGAYDFKFSELINYAEFVSLFDQYRINWVRLTFVPQGYTESMDLVTVAKISVFTYVVDYDDSLVPGSTTELDEYPTARRLKMSRGFSLKLYPKFAAATYNNGITMGYGARRGFLDMGTPSVPHYGFKYYATPTILANISQYSMYVKYCCTVRGIR